MLVAQAVIQGQTRSHFEAILAIEGPVFVAVAAREARLGYGRRDIAIRCRVQATVWVRGAGQLPLRIDRCLIVLKIAIDHVLKARLQTALEKLDGLRDGAIR